MRSQAERPRRQRRERGHNREWEREWLKALQQAVADVKSGATRKQTEVEKYWKKLYDVYSDEFEEIVSEFPEQLQDDARSQIFINSFTLFGVRCKTCQIIRPQ